MRKETDISGTILRKLGKTREATWLSKELRHLENEIGRVEKHPQISKRLQFLVSNELYIECVLIAAQMIEIETRELINTYISTINYLLVWHDKSIRRHIKFLEIEPRDRATLGELIKELAKYSTNRPLIKNLSEFNNARIVAVHRLWTDKRQIKDINHDCKSYYLFSQKIIFSLLKERVSVVRMRQRLRKRSRKTIN